MKGVLGKSSNLKLFLLKRNNERDIIHTHYSLENQNIILTSSRIVKDSIEFTQNRYEVDEKFRRFFLNDTENKEYMLATNYAINGKSNSHHYLIFNGIDITDGSIIANQFSYDLTKAPWYAGLNQKLCFKN
jgi:hypothetical protein